MQVSFFYHFFFFTLSVFSYPTSFLVWPYDPILPHQHPLIRYFLKSRNPLTAKDKRSKKQYRRDQTERRQKRIERSKAKGASKDVWGLRREGACVLVCLCYLFMSGSRYFYLLTRRKIIMYEQCGVNGRFNNFLLSLLQVRYARIS